MKRLFPRGSVERFIGGGILERLSGLSMFSNDAQHYFAISCHWLSFFNWGYAENKGRLVVITLIMLCYWPVLINGFSFRCLERKQNIFVPHVWYVFIRKRTPFKRFRIKSCPEMFLKAFVFPVHTPERFQDDVFSHRVFARPHWKRWRLKLYPFDSKENAWHFAWFRQETKAPFNPISQYTPNCNNVVV